MNKKLCPNCQTEIPDHSPGELCPRCVLCAADDESPNSISAPSLEKIAEAFPDWEVLSFIGQGGMGSVYEVHQPGLARTAALKILSPELSADPAFAERFAREARVMGKLKHPNIATIFESGEQGGYYYLLMEHIDGVNLREAMQAGRFTPEQALAVVPGICDALQAAHAEGIWHRDIKPENILLDNHGIVKIVDFGIARLVGDPQKNFTLTMTGQALGSNAYMAPEQHEKPHEVDHRADIYSLGVVIYELLTGELPLGRFPSPGERSEVNARIDEIVLKTLEKERDLRHQSAQEVKTDLLGASIRKETSSKVELSSQDDGSTTFFQNPDKFFLTSLSLWLGGLVSIFIGSYTSPVLIGLGSLAALFGLVACWWILWRIRKDKHPVKHRLPLIILAFWPCVCALILLPLRIWIINLEPNHHGITLIPREWWSFSSALYAVVAIIIPLVIAHVLWILFGKKNDTKKSSKWRIITATILVLVGMLFEQYDRHQLIEKKETHVVELALVQHGIWEDERHHFEKAISEMVSASGNSVRASIIPPEEANIEEGSHPELYGKATLRWRSSSDSSSKISNRCTKNLNARLHDRYRIFRLISHESRPFNYDISAILMAVTPLIIIYIIMFIVTSSAISGLIWASTSALIMSTILGLTNWPSLTPNALPYIDSVSNIKVIPEPKYKYDTTRKSVESLIKAAKSNDKNAFETNLSPRLRTLIRKSEGDISSVMDDWKSITYAHQNEGTDEIMNVFLKNKSKKKELHINLVRPGLDWKVDSLHPIPIEDEPYSVIERMIEAAKQKDRLRFVNSFWSLDKISEENGIQQIDKFMEKIIDSVVIGNIPSPESSDLRWIQTMVKKNSHYSITVQKKNQIWKITQDPQLEPIVIEANIETAALKTITKFLDAANKGDEKSFRECLDNNIWQHESDLVPIMKNYSQMEVSEYKTNENEIQVVFMDYDYGIIQTTLTMNFKDRKWKFTSEETASKFITYNVEAEAVNVINHFLDSAKNRNEKLFTECLAEDILNNMTDIKTVMQQFSNMKVVSCSYHPYKIDIQDKIDIVMKANDGEEEVTFVMIKEDGKWKFSSEGH